MIIWHGGNWTVETTLKIDDYGNLIKRTRLAITVSIFDIIGHEFRGKHQNILREVCMVGLGFLPALLRRLYGQNSEGWGRGRRLRRVGAVAREKGGGG